MSTVTLFRVTGTIKSIGARPGDFISIRPRHHYQYLLLRPLDTKAALRAVGDTATTEVVFSRGPSASPLDQPAPRVRRCHGGDLELLP